MSVLGMRDRDPVDDQGRHPALWGDAGAALDRTETQGLAELLHERFPAAALDFEPPVRWQDIDVGRPRLRVPSPLSDVVRTDPWSRVLHAVGRSYTDLVRARRGDVTAPDAVAVPRTEDDVAAVLDWCADAGAACIPFGGGTSVVGGVNPPPGDRPVVTLQLRALDRVLDVDATSRAARIQAGATGPRLEDQLRGDDLTLRFFPQSFEFSTLGGWIATRAGGHYATRWTHIDDLVESVTAITPSGWWRSARVPASGAGPSPDRLLLGSEGTLGVITEAWVRLQHRPRHRASAAVRFDDFHAGAAAVRDVAQSGLDPAGCRLLDPTEALLAGAGDGSTAVLLMAFESSWRPVDGDLALALEMCRACGGTREPHDGNDPSQQWRGSFVRAPYLRDALIGLGVVVETFETATTWDRFDALVDDVLTATRAAVEDACGDGIVTCRITHAYPDGAAPYFTVIAPARRGDEVAQWQAVKQAAAEVITAASATITHHHAVGRDHRPWYVRQRPEPFGRALRAVKAAVDPGGVLNPGVLVDQE